MIGDKVFYGYEMASYDALPIPLYMYGNVIGLDTDGYKSIIQVEWENGTITKGPRLQLEYQPDWKPLIVDKIEKERAQKR